MLPDTMQQRPVLFQQHQDGDDHRHELLPGRPVPLRPQRHGLRFPRQVGTQREAPPLGHHRHPVQEGALQLPGPQDQLPRRGGLQRRVPGGADRVRGHGRRRDPGGHEGGQVGVVDGDARVLGIHLEDGLQPPPPGAILHAHHQRLRQEARRQRRHSGQLEAQHRLPLLRAVQLIDRSDRSTSGHVHLHHACMRSGCKINRLPYFILCCILRGNKRV